MMIGSVQLSPCKLIGRMHTRTLPNLSKLAAICLMPMSTMNCEGGLLAHRCVVARDTPYPLNFFFLGGGGEHWVLWKSTSKRQER